MFLPQHQNANLKYYYPHPSMYVCMYAQLHKNTHTATQLHLNFEPQSYPVNQIFAR